MLPHIRFNEPVKSGLWNDEAGYWRIETTKGSMTATLVVMATGPLSEPITPDLPGLARFEGTVFHSARWNHHRDLKGKRVAVVGTGASAVQFIPEIQPAVAPLHLFQRTPGWVIPRLDAPIPGWRRKLYRRLPFVQRAVRWFIYLYREVWILAFRRPAMMRRVQRLAVRHLEQGIADPGLRAKLTPNYTMGCKRVLLSNDYYPALARPNVEVITDGVDEVRAHSMVGRDGIERPIDAIIFGTGFRPTDPPLAARIRGREGRALSDAWGGSPKAHVGTTVAGFPNLFILLGPNTGLGHNSVVYMTEGQIEHFIGAVRYMRRHKLDSLEPAARAQAEYVAGVDRRMRGTVWVNGGCSSWYLDRTGRNSALWPDSSWRFYRRVAAFNPREYVAHAR